MDLAWLFPYVLFLHVIGAIIAFGPTFSFSIMGAMGGAEPQHANFATRVSARISDRIIKPLAIFQGITGVLLIWISGRDLMASAVAAGRDRPVPAGVVLRAIRPVQARRAGDRADIGPTAA